MSDPGSAQTSQPSGQGARKAIKAQTRQRIMAAAKHLFSTLGYEGTTIRQIAIESGMSTGAVFVSFTGKADLFLALVAEDRAAAYEIVGETLRQRLDDPAAQVEHVIEAMFVAAYRSRAENVPFVQVAMGAAWSTELGPHIRKQLAQWPISGHLSRALQAAIERGQLAPDADLALLSQMLWDCALGMIPRAVFDGWSVERLGERLQDEVRAVLAGSRLRSA
ncbi:MAG TPA: TetR/AcrR family transcriptional regulator [Caulobacteraceae bacterium]|nr:TetR/AcrR family transcriptional regulator [Caulobacteraceae bacterium]